MRLFIGIRPDRDAVEALHQTAMCLKKTAPGRYVDRSLYHITLAFLGETGAELVPIIQAAMARAAHGIEPFPISLGPVGTFGPILWRGLRDAAALSLLSRRVCAALDEAAIPYDTKPFSAHITLARDSRLPVLARTGEYPAATFTVRTLQLLQSTRRDGHLCYQSLTEVPLEC